MTRPRSRRDNDGSSLAMIRRTGAIAFALTAAMAAAAAGCEAFRSAPSQDAAAERLTAAGAGAGADQPPPPLWKPLQNDGVHDPENEALAYLQQPAEALSLLPPAEPGGNEVNWVAALEQGVINPRTRIDATTSVRVRDQDIVMPDTAGMPAVVFPHKAHTEWLDCSNCHDKIFIAETGANDFGMLDILEGNYCGQCHGAVAFPLTQCLRCHSKSRDDG